MIALALGASLSACGADSTGPQRGVSGDYLLQAVNGTPLPYTWTYAGGGFYTLSSYRVSIVPGSDVYTGIWLSALSYSYSDRGAVVNVPDGGETGTWTYEPGAGSVALVSRDATTFFTGTLAGSTLTLRDASTLNAGGPNVYVFRRQ